MGNNNTIAQHHAEYFYELLCKSSNESTCIKYINRFKDFYDIEVNNYGRSALSNSIIYASDKVVYRLIERGADVNISDKYGDTPIIWAVVYNRYDVVKHLVEAGAEINHGIQCVSVLSYALCNGYTEIAKYLIDNGSDFSVLCYESNKIENSKDRYDTSATSYENFCKHNQRRFKIYPEALNHIKMRYKQSIHNIINDKSVNNVMARCFATTYVPQLVDVICEFII
ncbi:MAG: hypothetical protein Faunusvirus29_6 [Faunusvirus sp.]|jgi:ankyrin repeat protein|uniref:Uncharacterized protein n=1 Tax=Faunusvirus sp. TaxID=2487766 RepID=A0A3G4ZXH4_9VIRU|nr:MAG: hypothetical protein Faunusvirus29_6 [Faunusvirus sp.]